MEELDPSAAAAAAAVVGRARATAAGTAVDGDRAGELDRRRPYQDADGRLTSFATVLGWRERVTRELEPFRAAKHRSLDARVTIAGSSGELHALLEHAEELADLFIVSAVDVVEQPGEVTIEVAEHGGHRCGRCWKWFEVLATAPDDVCERCADALTALNG